MKKNIVLTFILVTSVFASSYAADVDGKWKGLIADQYEFAIDVKAGGEVLTGTATSASGEMKILDGLIKGNEISFKIVSPNYGELTYKGKVEGDTLVLSLDLGGQPISFKMTRVKP